MDGGPDSRMSSSAAENECSTSQQSCWMQEQDQLKSKLVLHDDFTWTFPSKMPDTIESSTISSLEQGGPCLQYIGGVDLSFSKHNPLVALGALIVLDVNTLQVVYEDFDVVQLTMPYIPGFLAFRESPVFLGLLEKMARINKALYPQLLMVDGNGILHPRGFGLASHLGVLADIPAIGVGKNVSSFPSQAARRILLQCHEQPPQKRPGKLSHIPLHHVDGLTDAEVRLQTSSSNAVPLVGKSGKVWGMALKGHESGTKPIFISIGHRISLETATSVVLHCCRYRIPEPVRQADIRSRERLRLMEHEFA